MKNTRESVERQQLLPVGDVIRVTAANPDEGVGLPMGAQQAGQEAYVELSATYIEGTDWRASVVETVGGVETEIGSRLIRAHGVHQVFYLPVEGTNVQLRVVRGIGPGSGRIDLGPIKIKRLVYTPQDVTLVVCNSVEDRYRFGFNGQMKANEIAGIGNHNTALFGELDTRLGRRWNPDPRPVAGMSLYSVFGNNPILNFDILLDTPGSALESGNGNNGWDRFRKIPQQEYSPSTDGLSAGELLEKGRPDLAFYSSFKALRNLGHKSFAKFKGQKTYLRTIFEQSDDGSYWQRVVEAPTEGATRDQLANDMDVLSFAPGGGGTPAFLAKSGPIKPSMVINLLNKVTSKYSKLFSCMECADAAIKLLKTHNINGEVLDVVTNGNKGMAGNIWSDVMQTNIATNGRHRAILLNGKVYDNINPGGIEYDKWVKDLFSPTGFTITKTPF